jgi:hypothetical protein
MDPQDITPGRVYQAADGRTVTVTRLFDGPIGPGVAFDYADGLRHSAVHAEAFASRFTPTPGAVGGRTEVELLRARVAELEKAAADRDAAARPVWPPQTDEQRAVHLAKNVVRAILDGPGDDLELAVAATVQQRYRDAVMELLRNPRTVITVTAAPDETCEDCGFKGGHDDCGGCWACEGGDCPSCGAGSMLLREADMNARHTPVTAGPVVRDEALEALRRTLTGQPVADPDACQCPDAGAVHQCGCPQYT